MRLKKEQRQSLLKEKLNTTPFVTDEELAAHFGVSVPTIRLDRVRLGIPELRERIKAMAEEHAQEGHAHAEVLGELIDLSVGRQGISVCRSTQEMLDGRGLVDPQYLYAQANSLAKAVLDEPVSSVGVGNIKYKNPVGAGRVLVAKAEVVRSRNEKRFVWVIIRDKETEVFRAKFILDTPVDKG